jgi:hypothetical protein
MHSLLFLSYFIRIFPHLPLSLVLTSGGLASLELIQVPAANGQTTLVLVHALAEVVDVSRASTALLLCRGVDAVLLGELSALGRCLSRRTAATAEPATDGVANAGSDCDTAA